MEKREIGRKSTRTIPVIIENHENAAKKTKLMVPSNYTAGHLVNILRSRMHLLPYHPVYLFLKSKQSPVLMSKSIGHLHHKHRDEKGLLRLIHAGQTSFGFRGNIRAIRFRQKWIENHHNALHQDAGGSQSYSGTPPPHFPLEPPSTANFGAPLDVDDLNDSIEEISSNDEFYNDLMGNFYSGTNTGFLNSDMTSSSQSATLTNSSLPSAQANSSYSSALTDWADPWLSSDFADNWLPSYTTEPQSVLDTMMTSIGYAGNVEESNTFYTDMDLATHILHNVEPNASANIQPPNVPNPQVPPNNLSLYESDSDLYESDNDVDMIN